MSVIFVPGASGALGSAVTRLLLENGDKVAGAARKKVELEHPSYLAIAADLSRASEAKRAVDETVEKFGALDAVVHVLGGFAGGEPVQDTRDEIIDRMLDMNYKSAFYVFRAALPQVLKAKERGRIIAVASRAAVEASPHVAAHAASKAALVALVKALAGEVKSSGVTVNAVLPSVIDTPENRAADPAADTSKWVQPVSIARVIRHLLSDDAKDISGSTIPIYGGA